MPVIEEAKPAPLRALEQKSQDKALESVLASPVFQKNPRLATLLEYLCARADTPESESPKEFTIATDVFGRTASFDSTTDSIVRVEMHRLRKKLREFYEGPGRDEPCQIVLEAGYYKPRFHQVAWTPIVHGALTPVVLTAEPLPHKSRRRLYWSLGFCLLCCLPVGYFIQRAALPPPGTDFAAAPSILAADRRGEVRILCGAGNSVIESALKDEWGPDRYFSGGTAVATPIPVVFRTRQPGLYQSARVGEFRYDIPLPPGPHEVRLHFSELNRGLREPLDGGENIRIFNVLANGALLLSSFDIAADASMNTADVKVFRDLRRSRDGKLHLVFTQINGAALLNSIEIVPGQAGRLKPIRVVTQTRGIIDNLGQPWSADEFFLQGRLMPHGRSEHGTKDSDVSVNDAERYGNFSYAIPVAEGRYTAKLHFIEAFWGPAFPGGGGAGSRIFDVYCNGQALWKKLDVFREAGSEELVKTATGLEPNAQGKINLSFVPVKNYAMVSAIEVLDEGQSVPH